MNPSPFPAKLLRLAAALTLALTLPFPVTHAAVSFEQDVAPILRTHCAGCHNDTEREGEFSVETLGSIRKGGDKGDPIRPGDADGSLLIRLIEGTARPAMPPKDEPRVPASDIARIRDWIQQGARGPARDTSILQHLSVPTVPVPRQLPAPITAVAASPDDRILAVGLPGRIELRSPDGKRIRRTLAGIPGKVNALQFSTDGKRLAVASGIAGFRGVAQIWDVPRRTLVREFTGHRDQLFAAGLSPDGSFLVTGGYDHGIRLWRVGDGELVWSNSVHNGAVFDLAFAPGGTVVASASADQTVKLWRVADGLRLDTLSQPQGELNAVRFTPDGRFIVATGSDRRIHQWRFISTNAPAINPVVESRFAHDAAITAMDLSNDGRLLATAAADRSLKLWALPDLTEIHSFNPQPDIVAAITFHPRLPRLTVARLDGSLEQFPLPRTTDGSPRQPSLTRADPPQGSMASPPVITLETIEESEPNDSPAQSQAVRWPVKISGRMDRPGDVDVFGFEARAGEKLTLAVNAAQSGSKMDSRIEVLDEAGQPVEQVVLQAVRDSWFTFRGKDSDTADDFRLHNWAEMELDEYLYANGEVVRLWLYPRGPDSGFKVYPGEGKRQTAFFTTAISHALNEPCHVVTPLPPGSRPVPNGLPVFRIPFANDDDPSRRAGTDSLLVFTAPTSGRYRVRITDTRGFGGGTQFHYTLHLREPQPDFSVRIDGLDAKVSPGSARELRFTATRSEEFDGPIRIEVSGLPAGFHVPGPIEIEAGQIRAMATLRADPDAADPAPEADAMVKVIARAMVGGREVLKELGTLGNLQIGPAPKLAVEILPGTDPATFKQESGKLIEFIIRPGQTIGARVRIVRNDFKERVELGGDDSGRNLPHGVYVDNIGLNGLLVVEGQTERDFVITAAPKARPGTRLFHLRATGDGGQCSQPALLRVLPREPEPGRALARP